MLVCSSPRLFAACHVLLRLLMPRHPSCALCSLTTKYFSIQWLSRSSVLVSTYSALTKLYLPACMASFSLQFLLLHLSMITASLDRRAFLLAYMVGVLGFEPRTSSLSGTRSNQLSYTPGRGASHSFLQVNPVPVPTYLKYIGGA